MFGQVRSAMNAAVRPSTAFVLQIGTKRLYHFPTAFEAFPRRGEVRAGSLTRLASEGERVRKKTDRRSRVYK